MASVGGQQTQGVTKYMNDVYKQCVMVMSQLQESFWRQKEKRRNDDAVYKAQFKRKRKRNEKIHAARFETVWQERQDKKSGKTCGAGVALTEEPEATTTIRKSNAQCKHCGRNDHQRKSNTLCPFLEDKVHRSSTGTKMLPDTVPANTQKCHMCIQCGFTRSGKPGQSNRGK